MKRKSRALGRVVGALGLSAVMALSSVGLSLAAHTRAGATLQLANDKPTWAPWFNAEGTAAAKQVGASWKAVEYADTTTYQAAIRTAGRTSKAPDLFTWWSGYLMTDIVNAGIPEV